MASKDKPNILYMLADDLGWGDISCHGAPIRTPNIDRLFRDGTVLDNHCVNATCTPTRASLLTGRFPSRFGSHATSPNNAPVMPDGYETLAGGLKNAGYSTGLFGKWHLGSLPEFGPNLYGFDHAYGSLAGGVDPYNHHYKTGEFSVTWHRNGELIEERGHVTDLIMREAVDWMESQKNPWFCYVPFTAVHIPIKAPEHWIDKYTFDTYDLDPDKDVSFKKYAAYASHMDWAVGQLMECVDRLCQRENTLVVFSSDNGAKHAYEPGNVKKYPGYQPETPRLGSNLPLRGEKAQLYEGGVRTPTVAYWDGSLGSKTVEAPMHIVDWMPTLANLAGYKPGQDPRWDGTDIWSVISGEKKSIEGRSIFWNIHDRKFALRKDDWKLVVGEKEDPEECELFCITADPCEKQDLAGEHPDRVKGMRAEIEEMRKQDGSSKRPDMTPEAVRRFRAG